MMNGRTRLASFMKDRPTNKELEKMVQTICAENDFDCREFIMGQISSGQTSMRSRWIILTEELGLRTTWVLAVFLLVAVVNLLFFVFSHSPEWEFLEFGTSSWGLILQNFPYGWTALAMVLLVFTIVAMKQFSWSYLFPFKLFSLLLVSGVFGAGGVAFATGINDTLYKKLIEDPGAGDSLIAKLYCLCANRTLNTDHALMGEVLFSEKSQMVIQTPTLDVVTVSFLPQTEWLDQSEPKTFSVVKMLGKKTGESSFVATHIKVHPQTSLSLLRSEEDCESKEQWQQTRELAERRRRAVIQPYTPAIGTVQLVKSIY